MKKIILSIITILGMASMLQAQLTDTVYGIKRSHYIGEISYYENCLDYHPTWSATPMDDCYTSKTIDGYQMTTSRPLVIRGIVAFVTDHLRGRVPRPGYDYYRDEYLFISRFDTSKHDMDYLAITRWDTATPYTSAFILTHDPSTYSFRHAYPDGYLYCRTYEAYFEQPIIVDSAFCVGGTFFGNEDPYYHNNDLSGIYSAYKCVSYIGVAATDPNCENRTPYYSCMGFESGDSAWHGIYGIPYPQLRYLPIVSYQWKITALSDDDSRGRTAGGSYYTDSTTATITAIPNSGFAFSHWDDGNRDNPRHVTVTSDSTFVAFFRRLEQFDARTQVNSSSLGSVTGGGTYTEFDTVTLHAVAQPWAHFVRWSDGDTNALRKFAITQDTLFTAIFEKGILIRINVGIDDADASHAFTITPNPARDIVTVTLADGCDRAHATLVLRDALGKELRRLAPSADKTAIPLQGLPAGTYLLTLTTPQGSSTQKLVIE